MTLTFDPASHTYALDGKRLPGVTSILRDEGFVDTAWFTEYSRDRGTKAHRAIELFDSHDLNEARLDPVLRPYLAAWKRFVAEAGVSIEASEVRLASDTYGFAGTIDKLVTIGSTKAIVDLKTGPVSPWVGLQLAAYHILVNEPARRRCAVQLNNDGSYRLHEFKDRQDRGVFLAALTIHNWKRRESGN